MTAKTKKKLLSFLFQLLAIAVGLLLIFPILYAISLSFMKAPEILTRDIKLLPDSIQWENYRKALQITTLGRYMINSVILAGVSSFIRVILASLSAFAFAFFEFKGKNFLFMLCMSTMMIPGDVVLVTNYKTVASLGLTDTYLGMMAVFLLSVLNIFTMRQYYLTFSKEIYEASRIDGCSNLRFYSRILLPLSKPVIATVYISSFVSIWNTYLWPMLVTNDDKLRTVQVGITMLNSADGSTIYGPIMAAAVMVLVPTVFVFVIFQKQIVGGMLSGSVKG
ncbi:carbohydrate ABC transporter permease [Angelakisella massiliensis]|uniref:carbohydrate ABC transporter permease n=1 Tax=Angelakisella massiliensis TaxID=1871018 RepID=UPI0023A88012|nr:carbohydrate ABC transporter permease [Angelakisella massiliensis]